MPEKIIIDTDPALGVPLRDIDDGLAIALALASPEIEIAGLTITHGNVDLARAEKCARRLLREAGREDIPVMRGAAKRGQLHSSTAASEFIVSSLESAPGQVTLIAIGPLSNLGAAETLNPGTLAKAKRIICMGGVLWRRGWVPPVFRAEFNIWKDPEAAKLFFQRAISPVLVPLDLTATVAVELKHLLRLRKTGGHFQDYLFSNALSWLAASALPAAAISGRFGFMPHDPLAVGVLLWPELYDFEHAGVDVMTAGADTGRTVVSPDGTEVSVARRVDGKRFLDRMFDRLAKSG